MAVVGLHRRRPRPTDDPPSHPADDWRSRLVRVGLADVQLALVAAAGFKALDVALRTGSPLAVGWLVAGWLTVRYRLGVAAVAVMGFGSNLVDVPSNHQTLIGWVGLATLLLSGRQLDVALRVTAGSVYAFAVANKIAGGAFLTGAAFVHGIAWSPVPVAWFGIGALIIQVWLVWAVWRRDWTALPLAAVFHLGVVVFMSADPVQALRLGVFNGLMLWLVFRASQPCSGSRSGADLKPGRRPRSRPCLHRGSPG